jgi:bifunctional non-homologous end joining protein LigD
MAGNLETYNSKRNFKTTREPRGRKGKAGGHSFVIQKHDATRLHYDFRLELDGVLKSWAVTRGPSLDPHEKRLAVHVEDHPLDYGSFEGTIPAGEYGGGTVLLWDRGTWEPEGDPHKGYAKGHLEFSLKGEKLSGRWHLVRMHGRPREKRENWLLIKSEDEAARPLDEGDILEERPESVETGRTIDEISGEEPGWSSKTGRIRKKAATGGKARPPSKAKKPEEPEPVGAAPNAIPAGELKDLPEAELPDFLEPQLATLSDTAPNDDRFIHEIKFDGYRLIARIEDGEVRLLTRSGLDWTTKFGTGVQEALAALPLRRALLDGEIVVETDGGASDFSALQADLSDERRDRFRFYLFDLMHLDGHDLTELPLERRKALLRTLIPEGDALIRYSDDFAQDGAEVLNHACRLGLEGIVSKLRDAPYRPGRTKAWIKTKCSARQEFVIGGYTPSTVSRKAIGALALGVYEGGKLVHVGRVGTGFSRSVAEELFRRLQGLRADKSPFAGKLTSLETRGLRYVRPELVAEVEFRAWTGDGHLRHASFRGLREDKPATEVQREQAGPVAEAKVEKDDQPKSAPLKGLTHPDRLYWPEQGVTKQGLAEYYVEMWKWFEPFIAKRPLALLRCPEGIHGEKFFQKHAWKGLNPAIKQVKDPAEPDEQPLIAVDSEKGMLGLAQGGTLEIHPWGSDLKHIEKPDIIILDLDPGEGVSWQAVIDGAFEAKRRLEEAGLAAFVKTSGGKGLHVVSPLKPKAEWPEVKAFTKAVADAMAEDQPDLYVSTITKAKRSRKIFVDYLRNQRGMTAVAPYSPRARVGAAVSMPLTWDELATGIGSAHFTVLNAPARMAALGRDPWEGFREAARPLPKLK